MEKMAYSLNIDNRAEDYENMREYLICLPVDPDYGVMSIMSSWLNEVMRTHDPSVLHPQGASNGACRNVLREAAK